MKKAVSLLLVLFIIIAAPLQITAKEEAEKVEVKQVLIDKTSLKLSVGESYKFSVYIKPGNADNKTVTVTSSKAGIVSVEKFNVKAVKTGETDLTFTASNGIKVKCSVTVIGAAEVSEDVTVESYPETVKRGENAELTLKALPNTEYSITVKYESGNSKAKGLENKTSDTEGYVSWKWKVGGKTSLEYKPIITVKDPKGKIIYKSEFEVTT